MDLSSLMAAGGWPSFARSLAFWAPLLWAVPLFGGRHLPAPARMSLALALAGFLDLPLLSAAATAAAPIELGILLHFVAGLCAALLLRLPFELVRGVGSLAATSRGTPTTWTTLSPGGDRAPSLGVALELALLAGAGAGALDHRLLRLVATLRQSLTTGLEASLLQLELEDLSSLGLWFFAALLSLGLPFLVATLWIDLALGILGRFLPQLPLFFLGQPLKAVGLLVILAHTSSTVLPAAEEVLTLVESLLEGGHR